MTQTKTGLSIPHHPTFFSTVQSDWRKVHPRDWSNAVPDHPIRQDLQGSVCFRQNADKDDKLRNQESEDKLLIKEDIFHSGGYNYDVREMATILIRLGPSL